MFQVLTTEFLQIDTAAVTQAVLSYVICYVAFCWELILGEDKQERERESSDFLNHAAGFARACLSVYIHLQ